VVFVFIFILINNYFLFIFSFKETLQNKTGPQQMHLDQTEYIIELINDWQRIKTFSLMDNGGTKTQKPDSDSRSYKCSSSSSSCCSCKL